MLRVTTGSAVQIHFNLTPPKNFKVCLIHWCFLNSFVLKTNWCTEFLGIVLLMFLGIQRGDCENKLFKNVIVPVQHADRTFLKTPDDVSGLL